MNHSIDFFRDEARNGFYIPTAIKQAWTCSLDVLAEIDRICTAHNITYYADWGTLLGAVRHGGFIPWDDDLDICMKRDDYISMKFYVDMPALFYSDEIWLQSENIKKQYLTNLVNFSDNRNKDYCENKLIVQSGLYDKDTENNFTSRKNILFCICPYEKNTSTHRMLVSVLVNHKRTS